MPIVVSSDPLTVLDEVSILQFDVARGTAEAGIEAHARLFGASNLHAALLAVAARLEEFKTRFHGPVQQIADFAVTSGHEALAFYAERLEGYARVRQGTLPRLRAELADAHASGRASHAALLEGQLDRAGEDFARSLGLALEGWSVHGAWIRRSIERETNGEQLTKNDGGVSEEALGGNACFFRDGDGWTVQFEGRREVVKNVSGMRYVQRLLMRPGVPVPAVDLDGLGSLEIASRQLVIDQDMARDMARRLREIRAELGESEESLTSDEKLALEDERTRLEGEVRAFNSGGKKRVMKSAQGDAVGRVRSAITRAIQAISLRHPSLGEHLKQGLVGRGGSSPCYRPAVSVGWRLNS